MRVFGRRSWQARGGPLGRPRLQRIAILRFGFGAMILLLLFSALETWRIREASSHQTDETYRRHIHTLNITTRIRRLIYQGSILARDYFLSREPGRRAVFESQLSQMRAESVQVMNEFERSLAAEQGSCEVRMRVEAFWSSIQTTIESPGLSTAAGAYEFLQSEIVPRRTAAGALLRELEMANERAMRQSENEFRQSRQSAIYRLFVVVGLCVLLAGAIAWLTLRWAARAERESVIRFEETAQARRDLQQLSARLLQVQEEEWSRLSRELHDEIGQTLTALRIEISGALAALRTEPDAAEQRLEEARLLAERTVETVRNISLLLRPSLLDDLGLEPALQSLVEEFNRRGAIACDFAGEEPATALPDSHRTCIYRVVQEALTNCARHSQARNVTVRLWQSGGEIHVEIHDDGKGFPAGPPGGSKERTGLGILGMRERVAALGGVLAIESAPGSGTRVSAQLPLPPAPAADEGGTDGDQDLVGG